MPEVHKHVKNMAINGHGKEHLIDISEDNI
jgi:hypothetical protein